MGGGDDPLAADQAAPAPDIVVLALGDQTRLPGILIDLGVLAPHNPRRPLSQAAVALAAYKSKLSFHDSRK